ncbi:MAG: FAD-binding protein [Myxococcota bacterium]
MVKSSRRGFVMGASALAITAFDPLHRTWLTEAHAQRRGGDSCGAIHIPRLDGELTTDAAALAEAASDFGNIISRTPRAVLRPGSERDVRRLIRFCNRHDIKVAMRGQGHAVLGEAQVDCGVVIDSRTLDAIHSIGPDGADVDAGVKWSTLLLAALDEGLTPLVLADYLEISVGGVLSVGGIGGNMNRVGAVVDNVDEIRFVTGEGRRRVCNRRRNRALFEGALGGLGQFGVITGAKIPLGPAPALVRVYELVYTNVSDYLADQRVLVNDARFGFHEGQIIPAAGGGWAFKVEVGAYYTPPSEPDDSALLAGLSPDGSTTITDFPYFVWLNRVAFAEQALRDLGLWDTPNPWSDLFLPDCHIEDYLVHDVLPFLTPDAVGAGLQLLYPFLRNKITRPFFKMPNDSIVWAYDILRFPFDPSTTDALLEENRRLYERAVARGGKQYPIGAVELTQREWVRHYGRDFLRFVSLKGRHDRRNIMTPGQGIFRF